MAKAKKCLCVVLAVMMVIGMFSFSVFAEDEKATFTVTTDVEGSASADDEITVTVSLTTNYYVCVVAVPITYDASAFTLVDGSVTVSDIFGSGTTSSVVNTGTAGEVYVVITPSTSGSPTTDIANKLTLFTFKLKANDVNGSYKIAVTDNQKSSSNPNGKWYCGSVSTADLKTGTVTSTGQTFTKEDAEVNIGSTATPELVAKDGTTGVVGAADTGDNSIDYTGYVYGVPAGADPLEYFEATNNGTVEAVANDSGVTGGTGATLVLKDSAGNQIATYTLIIFGDVNGDGEVNSTDTTILKRVSVFLTSLEGVQALAGDINGDGEINSTDATTVKRISVFLSTATVNPWA